MKKFLLAIAAAATLGHAQAAPTYMPSGVQTNISVSTVLTGGWTQCYVAPMASFIGNSAENVLNVCTQDYLMMAGRATGSNTLLTLAAGLRAEEIMVTGQNSNTHLVNGANWYYAPNWSWGYTAAGDTVSNGQCDVSSGPKSMCLHTVYGAGGYRINDIQGLNSSTDYEKIFFQSTGVSVNSQAASAVPEPASLALVGLALFGLGCARRRVAR